ncbi:MAG: cyclic lactone autoinducer peptide [Ruminococcus flavefaciens]|nr:cyclic lactone autoinducer peptide [Ruminococcus flavefaciens]
MKVICEKIAKAIKSVANMGAGMASGGFSYEPKMPKSLKK